MPAATRSSLPLAGWLLIAFALWVTVDRVIALINGPPDPFDDELSAAFMQGVLISFAPIAVSWLAIAGVLWRARWGFPLAALGVLAALGLRAFYLIRLAAAIRTDYGEIPLTDLVTIVGQFQAPMFWVYGGAEVVLLVALWMSRRGFQRWRG